MFFTRLYLAFFPKIEWELFDFCDFFENLFNGSLLAKHLQVAEDSIDDLKNIMGFVTVTSKKE